MGLSRLVRFDGAVAILVCKSEGDLWSVYNFAILGDPGADSGAEDENQNGREKNSTSKSTKEKYETLGTKSLRTSSKRPNKYSLLIGQKTFSRVSYFSFVLLLVEFFSRPF